MALTDDELTIATMALDLVDRIGGFGAEHGYDPVLFTRLWLDVAQTYAGASSSAPSQDAGADAAAVSPSA